MASPQPLRPNQNTYQVTVRVEQDGELLIAPRLVVSPGTDAQMEIARELRSPVAYDLPDLGAQARVTHLPDGGVEVAEAGAAVPTAQTDRLLIMPSEFETTLIGYRVPVNVTKLENGVIRVNGRILETTFKGLSSEVVVGEQTRDIYRVDAQGNKTLVSDYEPQMASTATYTTPFQVNARSGRDYQLKMPLSGGEAIVTVTVVELKPDGTPAEPSSGG